MRTISVLALVVSAVTLAGCAASAAGTPDEPLATTTQALCDNNGVCDPPGAGSSSGGSGSGITNDQQSQHDAGLIVAALLAGDLHGIPNTAQCAALRSDISYVESLGSTVITNYGLTTILGLPAVLYDWAVPPVPGLVMHAESCFPTDVNLAAFVQVVENGHWYIDPGPATLTATLGATTGSSAAAVSDGLSTTAWKWPKTMTYRPAFLGGESSEYKSVTQSAGFVTSCNIRKSGSYAASLCPLGY